MSAPRKTADKSARAARSIDDFAEIAVDVARAAKVDVLLCITESGRLFRQIVDLGQGLRLVAATASRRTYQQLAGSNLDVIRLPVRVSNRFREAQHAIGIALQADKIDPGNLVQCVIGQGLPGGHGDFIVLMDVRPDAAHVPLHELINLAGGVEPAVLDATLQLACRIGHAAHRGKRVGAIFMLGDSEEVMKGSQQLVPNPFQGQRPSDRLLTNPAVQGMSLELAKLDGAFVVRGDGFIQTAGAFLVPGTGAPSVSQGLGARHVTVAAVTDRTSAIGVVVSATDGNVRVFSRGSMIMRIEPDLPQWVSM